MTEKCIDIETSKLVVLELSNKIQEKGKFTIDENLEFPLKQMEHMNIRLFKLILCIKLNEWVSPQSLEKTLIMIFICVCQPPMRMKSINLEIDLGIVNNLDNPIMALGEEAIIRI